MRRARLIAIVSATAAVGCLWLFPIQRDEATSSSVGTGGSSATVDSGADSAAMLGGDEAECTGNADCVLDFSVCRASKCVQLKTNDCIVVKGKWDDPNAFIFGAYATEPAVAPETSQPIYNYEFAINELNAMGGLPDDHDVRHPLAAVICNNDPRLAVGDTEFYHRSLDHLVNDLGISAIVADLAPAVLTDAFQRTQAPPKRNVFFLSPGAANNDLLNLPNKNGLIWSMLGPPKDLAPGYADLVRRIEKLVDATADGGTTVLRVATVVKDDPNEVDHQLLSELLEAVRPQLFFNAASAVSQMNLNYREFHIDATSDAGAAAVGDAINDFAPHIVISMTGTDFTAKTGVASEIITKVSSLPGNDRWLTHEFPFFIASPINAAATNDFNVLLQGHTAMTYNVIYNRFLGISVAGADDRDLYKEYVTNLRVSNKAAVEGFENYYDAIYYLAYSVYVEGVEKALDGLQISTGMTRMSSGMVFNVGKTDIEPVFAALKSRDGTIKLIGTGGSLFDVPNGVRINEAGLYCYEFNNASIPLPHQPAEIFNASAKTWKVIFTCTPGL